MDAKEHKKDGSIRVVITHIRDFEKESGTFDEQLDKLTRLIYNAIYLDLNSFSIIIALDTKERYENYFQKKFAVEYENKYFAFTPMQIWEELEIEIQINKIKDNQ